METTNNGGITDILSYFSQNGFQRTNRYTVSITRPGYTILGKTKQDDKEVAPITDTFWATSVQIPSQTVAWFPESFGPSSPTLQIPLKREFDDRFLIDFIVDENWKVRKYFEDWINLIFYPQKGFSGEGLITKTSRIIPKLNNKEMLKQIDISALNVNGEEKYKFTLHEVFPKLLLPSQFANDQPNQYLTLTVDFNYRYYTTKTVDTTNTEPTKSGGGV
jgi:hypothetical protein